MRVAVRNTVALLFLSAVFICVPPAVGTAGAGPGEGKRFNAPASRVRPKVKTGKVAVQPFAGPNTERLRGLVVRIVRGRGFHPMTSLPRYEGTGQYPGLARDHHLRAFVTADLEERGSWQRITFLVWNGVNGSVVGRWTASARSTVLAQAVGKGFWQHLGPAFRKTEAPPRTPGFVPASPMRIDASAPYDDSRVAARQ